MGYHFSKHVLLRIPVFPIAQYQTALGDALKDEIFQAAIYLASPQFYERLQKAGFDCGKLTAKERHTVSRYFNRACFRPTPFGYFSSVTLGNWEPGGDLSISEPPTGLSTFLQPAEYLSQILVQQEVAHEGMQAILEPNPTLYRVNKNFRFIKAEIGLNHRRIYQLQSSLYSQVLNGLLKFCRNGQTCEAIIDRICRDANCDPSEGAAYLEFLQDAQILLPRVRSTITGHSPFTNIIAQALKENTPNLDLSLPGNLLNPRELIVVDQYLLQKIQAQDNQPEKSLLNLILVRQLKHKSLDEGIQNDLRQAIFALDRLCPADELPALAKFKRQFIKHFEGERIPLLLALDPELGIGYQSESYELPNPLLETVNIRPRNLESSKQFWTPAHYCLMAAWLKMEKQQRQFIDLEFDELNALTERLENLSLGASILFQTTEAGVYIESAGGNNPVALIGRFTMADECIYQAGLEIATEIESKNPDLLFAEILHVTDPHIDNVNRRRQLWKFQLPLIAATEIEDQAHILTLDDLYVQVLGDQIILWSKKHQKIVVPRLTSAYNHSIDELPLFRFLADISYQYGRTQLSFELHHYFSGFPFYPRVVFQGVILSPATWTMRPDELEKLLIADDWISEFKQLAHRLGLPEKFMVSEGDQQLVFNQSITGDLGLLRDMIRRNQGLILREYLATTTPNATVTDESGRTFQVQFNAFLLSDAAIPMPQLDYEPREYQIYQRKFIPGTEWLYLKLYVPRLSVNRLLLQLQPMIKKKFPRGRISQWFFVRYEDHAPHIRLRFRIEPLDVDVILAALRSILEENVHQHLIREFQIDVYSRELERYQAIGIEETEEFFWHSSNFVLQYLKVIKSGIRLPVFLVAAYTVKAIADQFLPESGQQEQFYQQVYEQYAAEFDAKKLRIELDQKYRETSRSLETFLNQAEPFQDKALKHCFRHLKAKAVELGQKLRPGDTQSDYLVSIIHLHLNRMFTDQQRQQEMVIYFLLAKWLRSQVARLKNQLKVNDQF